MKAETLMQVLENRYSVDSLRWDCCVLSVLQGCKWEGSANGDPMFKVAVRPSCWDEMNRFADLTQLC